MKPKLCLVVLPLLLFLYSCSSIPQEEISELPDSNQSVPESDSDASRTEPVDTPVVEDSEVVATFDTVSITKKAFLETKSEIELVVGDLNRITFARNYDAWLEYLSTEYVDTYSDPAVLESVSSSLPIKGIRLRNLRDYFMYVFVPSRQNMRVDDIQYVSPTRVYVIMELAPGSTAAIYILEKYGEKWQLVLKNQ